MCFFSAEEGDFLIASVLLAILLYIICDLLREMFIKLLFIVFGSKLRPGIYENLHSPGCNFLIVFICLALACMFYVAYLPNNAIDLLLFFEGC
jgi:hypothetical protein